MPAAMASCAPESALVDKQGKELSREGEDGGDGDGGTGEHGEVGEARYRKCG